MLNENEYVTCAEAAEILSCSLSNVRFWIGKPGFPEEHVINGETVFLREEVIQWRGTKRKYIDLFEKVDKLPANEYISIEKVMRMFKLSRSGVLFRIGKKGFPSPIIYKNKMYFHKEEIQQYLSINQLLIGQLRIRQSAPKLTAVNTEAQNDSTNEIPCDHNATSGDQSDAITQIPKPLRDDSPKQSPIDNGFKAFNQAPCLACKHSAQQKYLTPSNTIDNPVPLFYCFKLQSKITFNDEFKLFECSIFQNKEEHTELMPVLIPTEHPVPPELDATFNFDSMFQ